MMLDNGAYIENEAILENLKKLINQTYKLLPNREENLDWKTPLSTIIEEFSGMDKLLKPCHNFLFPLLCKLEGLYTLEANEDFFSYRRIIFECLNLITSIKKEVESWKD